MLVCWRSRDSLLVFSVLGDDYARDIPAVINDESRPAREIAEVLDIPCPTVYRRLNRLEAVGVVEG